MQHAYPKFMQHTLNPTPTVGNHSRNEAIFLCEIAQLLVVQP